MAFQNNPNATATVTVEDPIVLEPAYDETVYSYGFENYSATTTPSAIVYSFGGETYNEGAVTVPAQQVYSQSFEFSAVNPDGWSAPTGTQPDSNPYTGGGHTGSYYMWASGNSAYVERTMTGLTVGRQYTATAWGRPLAGSSNVSIGVAGLSQGPSITTSSTTWVQATYTFTATATSHVLQLFQTGTSSRTWDDVSLTRDAYTEGSGTPNDGLDGWTGATNVGTIKRGGNRSLQGASISRTFTGLEAGRTYNLRGWYYNGTTWTQSSQTFTPVSTTATRTLTATGATHWDDIVLTRNAYTTVHNNGQDGWTATGGASVVTGNARNGTYALYVPNAPTGATIARAFTGLVIGHKYTMSGYFRTPTGPWQSYKTIPYTAASTAQAFSVPIPPGATYWDDMALVHHVPAVVTYEPELPISDGDVTLDSGRYPYVQAGVEVPLTGENLLEQLKVGQRVTLNATDGTTSAELDLSLRQRTVSHDGKRITLDLASDEAITESWSDVQDDSTPRNYETSLRSVVNYVLGKSIPGTSLQIGPADADMTATWDSENLQTNPAGGANLDGWFSYDGAVSRLTTGTFPAGTGIASAIRCTMNAGTTGGLYFNGGDDSGIAGGTLNVQIREKNLYRVSAWVRTSVSKSIRLSIQQRNNANTQPGANLHGPVFTTTANTWHRLTFVFQAYPGAVRAGLYVYLASGTWSAGQTIDLTGVIITEGTADTPYFDGGTTLRTDLYAYAWNGTPHLSSSKRTALIERSPDAFTWKAAQSAWDFLRPLVASAGLRLYCDEQRRWWLIDPAAWTVPGRFSARPDNTVEGTDTIDAEDEDSGVTGVVAVFRWRDSDGTEQTRKDTAGVAGKVKELEFNSPYPGPGLAAAHLTKIQGQNRVQDVTVATDYTVRPGQEIQIDLPGTYAQLGTLTTVRWELVNGLMSLGSSQLRETPPGSIDLLPGTIDSLPGSIDSLT